MSLLVYKTIECISKFCVINFWNMSTDAVVANYKNIFFLKRTAHGMHLIMKSEGFFLTITMMS